MYELSSMSVCEAFELGIVTPHDIYSSDDVVNIPNNVVSYEWVTEKYTYEGKMKVIGKVIPNKETLFLNNDQLEVIFDLANWSVSQPREVVCLGAPYDMQTAYNNGGLTYIPLCEDGIVNDDVFIRKHYDCDNGFFIVHNKKTNRDEWRYGTRNEFRAYCSLPIYMRR